MDLTTDPSILVGLLTLLAIEIFLGIDNIIFISIIANKLLIKEREKARVLGLFFAFIMRLILLTLISWSTHLTKPLLKFSYFTLTIRNIIFIVGGFFLFFKGIIELYERLKNYNTTKNYTYNQNFSNFWVIVFQIVVIDVLFSLDAIITAVGIVNNLFVVISAIIISMIITLIASKALIKFINTNPNVLILCISIILMIGLNLIVEGFGFFIPKGYIYTSIIFSIFVEMLNQISHRNIQYKKKIYLSSKNKK
ncbi:TerC family protein [Candidatus Tachikawaea gelatinosa]|uniref:Integral membrane protein TerC n=1 Tax=Candidatus Tachikawaea gelatinosa TaxID=1410383 RepID=A0A090ALH0_9ENTR|nr:TerC family protein [Candidatus Tachikawaea gelatinosa]BAP58489.1 integral membrane protein TerC [Candidatus Tachikawaea gelatinosa]